MIQQGNLFEDKVIAFLNEFRILLQEIETLLIGLMQTLVKLVELHQHATVCLIEMESLLHIFKGLILTILLVEASQC